MAIYSIFYSLLIHYFLVANCKQFGYLNLFTCHCKDDRYCNYDGTCEYNGCTTGWYGSTCQKQNVALKKQTYQVSTYNNQGPGLVVDGDRSQSEFNCMDTGFSNNTFWRVDLINTYPIRQIHILYRSGEYDDYFGYRSPEKYLYTLKGFQIDVIQDNGARVQCYKQPDNVAPSSTDFTVTCSNTIYGSSINISNTIIFDKLFYGFCEVEVYVCSYRTYGANCEKFCYCKDNVPCDDITGECPTKECLPRYTGTSCNQECPAGTYGNNCLQTCPTNCLNLDCNHINGNCNGGCKPGFISDYCDQKCRPGTYGNNCSQTCSINCLNKDCNHINGKCIGECKPGFKSELCDQKCSMTMYGINCSRSCDDRNCTGSTECNHITGNCTEGCKPGFSGDDCISQCPTGFYGKDCSKMCSERNCLQNQTCDSLNGACVGGCKPGFISTDCTQECDEGFYGVNCNKKCSERNCINNSTDCSKVDGSCNGECVDGYSGIDCRISSSSSNPINDDDKTSTIIGVSVGIIVILLVVMILGFVYFRRRISSISSSTKGTSAAHEAIILSNSSKAATPTAGHIYINDTVENKQSNDNHYNTLEAAYLNENPYTQIEK